MVQSPMENNNNGGLAGSVPTTLSSSSAAAAAADNLLFHKIAASIGRKELVAILLGTLLVPIVKVWYEHLLCRWKNNSNSNNYNNIDDDGPDNTSTSTSRKQQSSLTLQLSYENTKFYHIFKTISEGARLFVAVTIVEIIKVCLLSFDNHHDPASSSSSSTSSSSIFPKHFDRITHVFGFTIFIWWGLKRLSTLKLYLLTKLMVQTDIINNPGRLQIINRLSDFLLLLFGIVVVYEVFNYDMGYSFKSVVVSFSFATAVVSLATKDIITNFLNGILLSASNRIYEGDFIIMNGGSGAKDIKRVKKLGWLETALRGSDNLYYTIPNTELLSSQISNLSRIPTCQVHQTLRLPYNAVSKVTQLSHDIKCEIRQSCPSVITDGSHPFRCYWINFQTNYLEVIVDAHFRIQPVGDETYYDNRQQCLQAIDRAMQRNNIPNYSGSGS